MSKLDIKLVEKMYSDYGQELTPERLEYIKDEFSNNNDFNKSFLNKYDPEKAVSEAEVEKKNLDTTTTLDVAQSDSQEPPKKKSTLSVGGKPVPTGASASSAGKSKGRTSDELLSEFGFKNKEEQKKAGVVASKTKLGAVTPVGVKSMAPKEEVFKTEKQKAVEQEGSLITEKYKREEDNKFVQDFRNATSLPENYENQIKEDINNELSGAGVWNTISQGASEVWNKILPYIPGAPSSESEIKRLESDVTFLPKAKEEYKNMLLNNGVKEENITEDDLIKGAIDLETKKRIEDKKLSLANDYLDNLPNEIKNRIESKALNDAKIEDAEVNKKLKLISALDLDIKNDNDELIVLEELSKKNNGLSQSDLDRYNELRLSLNEKVKTRTNQYNLYKENVSKLTTAEQEYDLFKRSYGFEDKAGKVLNAVSDFGLGALQFINMLTPGANQDNIALELAGIKNEKDKLVANKFQKQVDSAKNINDILDYGTDVITSQSSNIALGYLTGGTGMMIGIGTSSAGNRYSELIKSNMDGKTDYSKLQMYLSSGIYGGAEMLESNTFKMLGGAKNIIKKAIKNEPSRLLFKESIAKKTFDSGKEFLKNYRGELGEELTTYGSQKISDIVVLDIDSKDVFKDAAKEIKSIAKDTGVMVVGLNLFPATFSKVANAFAPKDYTYALDKNNKAINDLSKILNNNDASDVVKLEAKNKIDQIVKANEDGLVKIIKNTAKLDQKLIDKVVEIEVENSELRNKANQINEDKTISKDQKQVLLSGLKDQFVKNELLREDIVGGRKESFDILPEEKSIEFKKNAAETLKKEEIAKGVEEDKINITSEAINNKAKELYNQEIKKEDEKITGQPNAEEKPTGINAEQATSTTQQENVVQLQPQEEINKLKTQEDAIQKQSTNEGLLQPEQSKMGLQEVEQGNAEQEVVAEQSKEKINNYVSKLESTKASDPDTYWSVSPVTVEDASESAIIDTEDGAAAVKPDGDIVGVFKKPESKAKGVAQELLNKAVEAGGIKLDNFDGYLTKQYEKAGFRVVSKTPFNEDYAPPGWNKEKHGTPDVVAMVYDPKGELDIQEKTFADKDTGYDDMIAYRDALISDKMTNAQNVRNKIEGSDFITISPSDKNIDDNISKSSNKKIASLAVKAVKAVSKVLPDVKVVLHNTNQSFVNVSGESKNQSSNGLYINGEIHINLENANKRTVAHEIFHAILFSKVKTDAKASEFTRKMINAILPTLDKNPALKERLQDFADNYEESIQNEEKLAELFGIMAENYSTFSGRAKEIIKNWINGLAKMFGIEVFQSNETLDILNAISKKVATGTTIEGVDLKLFDEVTDVAEDWGISLDRQQKRTKPDPVKTVKAYKLFRVSEKNPGKIFPLFVDANTPVEIGSWIDADMAEGYSFQGLNGHFYIPSTEYEVVNQRTGKVEKRKTGQGVEIPNEKVREELIARGFLPKGSKSKSVTSLARRPGWHSGDLPMSTHLGSKSQGSSVVDIRSNDQVWAEVEMAADVDWQKIANDAARTTASGGKDLKTAHITDRVPEDGFYKYKTNPNMTGSWIIGGSMKVNRILSDEEVAEINKEAGVEDLPREKPFDAARFGIDELINVSPDTKKVNSPVELISRKQVGGFDVKYTEQEKIDKLTKDGLITEPEDTSFMNNEQVAITSPDDMLVGTISIDGKEIFEGGGGVFFVTKYGDVWASGKEGTANTLATAINNSLRNNKSGKGYLVLTKGSDSKLISSSSGVNSSLAVLESMLDKNLISLSDFRSAVSSSIKTFGGEISLRASAKQMKEDINTYFSNPKESTFQRRGDVLNKIIASIAQSKSTKDNKDKIIEFLGGDKTKGIVTKVTTENKSRNQSLSDLIAGVASEKLTKGLSVGDVYAIIEVNGEVVVKEDSHPSYPFHVVQKDGKKPILHLPKLRENGSKTITTSSGKPYSVGNVSIMSGKFNDNVTRLQKRSTELADVKKEVQEVFSSAKEALKIEKDRNKVINDLKDKVNAFVKVAIQDLKAGDIGKRAITSIASKVQDVTDQNFEEKLGEVNDILDNLYTNRDVNKAKSDKKKAFKNVMSGKVGKLADRGDRAKVMASKIVNFALLDPSTIKKVLNDSDFGLYTDYISNLAERKDALSDTDLKSYNDLYDSIAAPYKKHTDKVNEIQGKIDANQGLSESEKSFVDKNKSDFYEKEDVAEKEEADENRRAKKAAEVLKKKNQIKSFIPFMKDVFEQSIAEKGSLEWKILSTLVSLDESDVDAMPDTMLSNAINAMTSMVENDVIPTYAEDLYRYTIKSKAKKLFLDTVAKAGKGGLYSTKAGRAALKVREILGNPLATIRGIRRGDIDAELLEKRIKMFRFSAIDAALKIYGETPIFDGIASVLGKGMSSLANTEAKSEEALLNAKKLIDKKSKNPQESYMKITYHLIDAMAKNNQGTKSDVSAIEYFEATITDKESKIRENKRALKDVEDFVSKIKSNNNVVELTPEEAAAANAIRIVLEENQMSAYEANLFQNANAAPMINEYFPVSNSVKGQTDNDLANMKSRFGIGSTVSTKSGNLEEKSGKAHPIDMNPFTATFSSIKNTAVQFNLRSEYLAISQGLKESIKESDKEGELFLNGIQKALDSEFDLIVNGSIFGSSDLMDNIFNAVDKTFYQVMLGSVISRSIDYTGNIIQLAALNPKFLFSGNKIIKDLKRELKSGESEVELLRSFYKNAEASDINKMILSKNSSTERTEFLNKGVNKDVLSKGLPMSNILTRIKAKFIAPVDEKLEGINEGLISVSDVKPYGIGWNSVFRDTFLTETGNDVDVVKIARGDKKYLKDNANAIKVASNKANREAADLFGSTNPFEKQVEIMEASSGRKNTMFALSAIYNRAKYFLSGFTIGANTSMTTAINTFIETKDPREARKALGGAIRIGMYRTAVSAVSGMLWSLAKGDDDDEDKLVESFDRLAEDDKFIKEMNNLFLDFPIRKDRDGNQVELSVEDFKKYNELRDKLLSNKDFKNAYDTYYKFINRNLFDEAVRLRANQINSSKEKVFKQDITMFFDEIKKGFPKNDTQIIETLAVLHSNEGMKLFTSEEIDGYILDLENHMSKIGFLDNRALRNANSQIDRMIINETALLLSEHRNQSAGDIVVKEGAQIIMGWMFPRSNNLVKGLYNYAAESANKMIIQSRRGERGYDLYKDMVFQPLFKTGLSDKSQGVVEEAIGVLNPALKDLLKKDNKDAATVSLLRYIKTIGTLGLNDFNKINSKMKNDEIYQKTNGKFKENIIKDIAKSKVDIIREVTDKEGIESDAKERGAYKSRVLPGIDSTEVKSKLPSYMNKKDLKINGRSIE